jgi:hypothetical protein
VGDKGVEFVTGAGKPVTVWDKSELGIRLLFWGSTSFRLYSTWYISIGEFVVKGILKSYDPIFIGIEIYNG